VGLGVWVASGVSVGLRVGVGIEVGVGGVGRVGRVGRVGSVGSVGRVGRVGTVSPWPVLAKEFGPNWATRRMLRVMLREIPHPRNRIRMGSLANYPLPHNELSFDSRWPRTHWLPAL